ncbi:FAD-dependent oxidoreductase [Sphaerotilus sp.]|uniref:FAD-dependent oxidoreductase n=1 Tax=Sphaerotilus sp. TaxID=2093942 RepID=UPI00286DB792|nr:FAD-dependent oxidoreductase [Sphaerotilus sp.]
MTSATQTAIRTATDCDLLVVGSGAGGLSAAVTAAELGLRVVVVEKAPVLGGTTAWSGGWMWIPRNPLAVEAGFVEDADAPRRYLHHVLGAQADPERLDAFLHQGPRMVGFFRSRTALQFIDGNAIPDFHGHAPGAAPGGRSVCAAPFDARQLGARLADLRRPLDLVSLWGMGIAAGADLRHFLHAMRAWPSFVHAAKRVTRHLADLALHGRGQHLVAGNALVARLLTSALDRGVELRVSSPVRRLLREGGRVVGAVVAGAAGETELRAGRGVVLACGGFPHDVERMRTLFPHAPTGREHWSAAPPENTGDGLRLGESVGAEVRTDLPHAGAWAPVSLVPRADGSTGHFPHLIERGKPGLIAVTRDGRRFVNEAGPYHDFMAALFSAVPAGEPVQAWLVCDHRFIRRYGLGHAKPAPMPLGPSLRSGYLRRGRDLLALAEACGIDAAALRSTVAAFNAEARHGRDPAFGRGATPYNRMQGDAAQQPNPCVAPIEHGPFYAVRVVPGSLGTFAGLRTDASARVLGSGGEPIPGLYAAGNDMASVMGGGYPSGGITLGPAMTFGFIAGHHAAGVALPTVDPNPDSFPHAD